MPTDIENDKRIALEKAAREVAEQAFEADDKAAEREAQRRSGLGDADQDDLFH